MTGDAARCRGGDGSKVAIDRRDELAQQIPFYQQRHSIKPGITGWAQVKYQYGSSIEDAMEKLRYDLYYIKHLSLALDLSIVFDTVKVIVFGKGAK
jgi:lipopolysaccharide/colanic/teichoic acid biosynthesis glycosyltransferase